MSQAEEGLRLPIPNKKACAKSTSFFVEHRKGVVINACECRVLQ